ANESSLPFVAVDGHTSRVPVKHLQSLRNICHADSHAWPPAALFQLSTSHTNAIVFDLTDQSRIGEATAKIAASAVYFRRQAVLDAVFHQRLQQHAGDDHVE